MGFKEQDEKQISKRQQTTQIRWQTKHPGKWFCCLKETQINLNCTHESKIQTESRWGTFPRRKKTNKCTSFPLACHIPKLSQCSIDPVHAELQLTVAAAAKHLSRLTPANGQRCSVRSWNKWQSIIVMTIPAGLTEVSSLLLKTVLGKQRNASCCALRGFATQPMPEVLFPILYRMNKHSHSHGFSTSRCGELCFKLNACHRRCQISWINAVVKIITCWSEMKLILCDSRCGVVCGRCCGHIGGWRGFLGLTESKAKSAGRVWTLPEGRLQGLDQTEKTSENLDYGLVPSGAGLLSGEKVKQKVQSDRSQSWNEDSMMDQSYDWWK